MIRKVIYITALLFSQPVFAECLNSTCDNVLVEELYIQANGDIYVATSGDEENLSTCTTVSNAGTHLTLKTSDSNTREIFSALLAAQRAGKPVQIRVGTEAGCDILYVRSRL